MEIMKDGDFIHINTSYLS